MDGCHLEPGAVPLQRRGHPSSFCKCLTPRGCTLPGVLERGPAGRHDYEFEYTSAPNLPNLTKKTPLGTGF